MALPASAIGGVMVFARLPGVAQRLWLAASVLSFAGLVAYLFFAGHP